MVPNWALVKLLRWIAPSNVHRSKPRTRPLAERLAPRLLFDVQMDTPSYDSIVGNPSLSTNVFVSECEATNLAFTPGGTSTPTIISAFTDTAMLPYATDPNYFQVVGAASSSNGGTSFSSPSAPILPLTGPTGDSLGTGGNAVLARDNASGTIYLATLSGDRSHSEIQMFQSTNNGATFTGPTIATPGASGGFDKPWLAIDNYPGGNSQAYLTYMYNGQIYLSTRNSGGSWPDMTFARQITSAAQPFAPVIVPTPDHKPYIVYYDGVGGSDGGAAMMYAWAGDGYTPHLLADLNLADPNEQINVWVQTGNPNVQIRGNVFPAVAFNPVSTTCMLRSRPAQLITRHRACTS